MRLVVPADLVEEICLRLPLKSLLKFKTVSKQWRSILVSRSFAKRRRMIMNTVQNKPQILAAAGNHRTVRRLNDDEEEVEMFYLHCDAAATRPSLTCDGLVCIPVPGWINVLNPSTGELLRFPSGPDPVKYYPQADRVRCISSDIRVISPFSENLFPLRHLDSAPGIRTFGFQQLMAGSWISRMSRRIELQIADILFTTAVAASVIFFATRS